MAVVKAQYPILEYDSNPKAVMMPGRKKQVSLPAACVMTFFGEVVERYAVQPEVSETLYYRSEMKTIPIYRMEFQGKEICLCQCPVGSASAAAVLDYLIAYGVKNIIACGGCGVLTDIPAGYILLPTAALRDEGTSYHYLPPTREILLDEKPLSAIRAVIRRHNIPFLECKTWTTDGIFRETEGLVAYRKSEGCTVVEMECSALAACARFRGASFGQVLYSGDILLATEKYDERNWMNNVTAREKLFLLALESVVEIEEGKYI